MFENLVSLRARWLLAVIAFLLATIAAASAAPEEQELEKSVVRILNFSQWPVWSQPWKSSPIQQSSGTGFLVDGKMIMTNAHVVSWSKQLLVFRSDDPKAYLARVKFIGHDCDLAVIEAEDENFYRGLKPLSLGELPKVRSTVFTYGYPAGGQQISYTRGVVSRIEVIKYVHIFNRAFLAVQTDAAINPGNSGGPVLQDDKVVGVAFQGNPGLENTGFFIPPPVVKHFLDDIKDGQYHGFPDAGIALHPLENYAHRASLGLKQDSFGTLVAGFLEETSRGKPFKEGDVLLKVGSFDVGRDGNILYNGNRVFVGAAFDEAQHGEKLKVLVWRGGKETELDLEMKVITSDHHEGAQYDIVPRYVVRGGLVFVNLSRNYVASVVKGISLSARNELLYYLNHKRGEYPGDYREEAVVLVGLFPDECNSDMRADLPSIAETINGIPITRLADVVKAFKNPVEGFHVIELSNGQKQSLRASHVSERHQKILDEFKIPAGESL